MTHRGRLNVLSNILGKSYETIFSEFEDSSFLDSPFGSGDVKYHKGYSSDRQVQSGERVHLTLTSNPSHLEAVDPVVVGRTKAKQVRANDAAGKTILPVILHGDSAFAGQGMVAETFNLSQLHGYCTGGTIHIVVNNQIGFTTTPAEARSTLYCTDIAKMIQVPILHVNGDEPEAVIYCVRLALAYRERFGDDVVIDMGDTTRLATADLEAAVSGNSVAVAGPDGGADAQMEISGDSQFHGLAGVNAIALGSGGNASQNVSVNVSAAVDAF